MNTIKVDVPELKDSLFPSPRPPVLLLLVCLGPVSFQQLPVNSEASSLKEDDSMVKMIKTKGKKV
eukprot:5270714-Ditylum_brightwellii.AAC.1